MTESKEHIEHVRIHKAGQIINSRLTFYQQEIQTLFDELIHNTWGPCEWEPDTDIMETEDVYIIEMDIPGIDPESIEIRTEDHRLSFGGNREPARPEGDFHTHLSERPMGSYCRTFEFAQTIESYEKSYRKGVLKLVVKKS